MFYMPHDVVPLFNITTEELLINTS